MGIITLLQALKQRGKPKERWMANVKVVGMVSPTTYKVADLTAEVSLEVTKLKTTFAKYLQIGRFVKIVDPTLDKQNNRLIVTESSLILLGRKIEGMADAANPGNDLSICANLDPQQDVPGNLVLKVVKVQRPRKVETRYGQTNVQQLFMKDIHGDKIVISIWQGHPSFDKIEDGKVYTIGSLKTERYPEKKPHNLSTKKISKFDLASKEIQEEFCKVKWQDDEFEGTVVGFMDFLGFSSCMNCRCSVRDEKIGSNCPKCSLKLEEVYEDFRCTMIIENEESKIEVVLFKRDLGRPIDATDIDDIENFLNIDLEGKKVRVGYSRRVALSGEENLMCENILFL